MAVLCSRHAAVVCIASDELNFHPTQVYKDANHKPEMAIAITDFEALCGFVPHHELTEALKEVPELREVIGDVSCWSPPEFKVAAKSAPTHASHGVPAHMLCPLLLLWTHLTS